MRILGVDPGIGRCGWGVIDSMGSKVVAIDFGCIETSSTLGIEKRLEDVYSEINKIIKKHKPEFLSIEDLFFGSNAKTAFVVGQARGVILLSASQNKLETAVYTPQQVKLAVTGYGKAEKKQVEQMVKILLKLKEAKLLDDTYDALAIAITHAFSSKFATSTK